jgi:hypothetical protein
MPGRLFLPGVTTFYYSFNDRSTHKKDLFLQIVFLIDRCTCGYCPLLFLVLYSYLFPG